MYDALHRGCSRCSNDGSGGLIMSMFNAEMICLDCKDKERKRPDYKQAEAKDLMEYAGRLRGLGMDTQAGNVERLADTIKKEG